MFAQNGVNFGSNQKNYLEKLMTEHVTLLEHAATVQNKMSLLYQEHAQRRPGTVNPEAMNHHRQIS